MYRHYLSSYVSELQEGEENKQENIIACTYPSINWKTLVFLSVLVHIVSILAYLRPISISNQLIFSPTPILDEMHILSSDHEDVMGSSSLRRIFVNDYWGRPMNSPSSHKSYRPLTIVSFRSIKAFLKSQLLPLPSHHEISKKTRTYVAPSNLYIQRVVNILLHSAIGETVARLALWITNPSLHTQQESHWLMYLFVKIFFLLHPTHIETVVNMANRAHLLALCFVILQLDPQCNIIILALLHVVSLLTSETAIFTLPAILLTMIYIEFSTRGFYDSLQQGEIQGEEKDNTLSIREEEKQNTTQDKLQDSTTNHVGESEKEMDCRIRSFSLSNSIQCIILQETIVSLLPRIVLLCTLTCTYLIARYFLDWLSIPDGLIRPAENPFYFLKGWKRWVNYSYILAIHVSKALGIGLMDWVGFSHEYGYDCIPSIDGLDDGRICVPIILCLSVVIVFMGVIHRGIKAILIFFVAYAWMATLFPVTGIIKVGTFVADRLVVTSSVVGSIFWGWILSQSIQSEFVTTKISDDTKPLRHYPTVTLLWKCILILTWIVFLFFKIDRRSTEWMDHRLLLESSLRSCPRSAKSNLEISKIYSGLVQERLDLDKAMRHLETAEEIDPNYCDVHFQVAQILFRKGEYINFEERLVRGILCPFSMQGAADLWNRYWSHVLADNSSPQFPQLKKRYLKYQSILNDAIQKELASEKQRSDSYLIMERDEL